ncbi:transmembrane and coiled-coil domain-containing protein 5B [Pyrus ussuriensis x Pyrus communis]|uniref:Transmembrane and coiled-coil domain-containing protein 5B n=1 Tax=Pyrus ussuriensis x Pyrus communis TaxID=2448454 RepID=A0A5N5FJ16_9ROSA|nr:transmembrane and coiled-coil domain-containing protein 5B [Pyrus ussuriensis x Pyrus communis]
MLTAKASNKKRRTEPWIANSDHFDLDLDLSKYDFPIHRFFFFQIFHINGFFATSKVSLNPFRRACENCLKTEAIKFQATGIISKYEEEKERLCARYEQLRKRERSLISEHEKGCADKIAKLEESLKKKKQDDRTFSVLRKTLGSFLDNGSDEDIPADD